MALTADDLPALARLPYEARLEVVREELERIGQGMLRAGYEPAVIAEQLQAMERSMCRRYLDYVLAVSEPAGRA